MITETKSFTNLPAEDLFFSKANDVIIPSSGETKEDISTASCVMKDNIALGGDINVIRGFNNGVFLSYYLNHVKKNDIAKIAQGISIIHLYNDQLKSLLISIPSLQEQNKIAFCLSSVDKLISYTRDKLKLLKLQKKSLMQKLFPAQGEKIPKYRFKEFENDGEWVENKLGNIISTISPLKKLQLKEYKKEGKYPIVDQSQNFICGYSNDSDAVINVASEKLIVFGDHTCTLKFVDFPFIQGADGIKIFKSLYSDMVDVCFLYQFLLCFPIVSKEYKRHFSELKEKIVCYPQNVKEQNRIATCLFIIDECINQFENKITWLELCKKGLMQQLFPLT